MYIKFDNIYVMHTVQTQNCFKEKCIFVVSVSVFMFILFLFNRGLLDLGK